jgi:hypothetical protein
LAVTVFNMSAENGPLPPSPAYTKPEPQSSPHSHTIPPPLRRKPVPARHSNGKPGRINFFNFDRSSLNDRTYFNLRKRTFLLILLAHFLTILALILGLSIGLTQRKKSQNLPLPSSSEHFTGDLTYYSPALGACGITSSDSDSVCAVSHLVFDAVQTGSDPNANPLCGLKIRAQRYKEGVGMRSEDLTVVDRCVGCAARDIDVSPKAFEKLADPALGRVLVTWAWLNPVPTKAA